MLVIASMGCELLVGADDYALVGERPDASAGDGGDATLADGDATDANAPPPNFGDVTVLARGQMGPRGIALTATDVVWTNFDSDTLASTSKAGDGGTPGPMTGPDHDGCLDVVAYGSTLAWLNTKSGSLIVKPLATTAVEIKNCGTGVRLTQDAVNLFYVELCYPDQFNLWRVPKAGPKAYVSQVSAPDGYGALVSDGISVFVAKPMGIQDVTVDAGLFAETKGPALDVAVDATAVYWLQSDGTVNRRDKAAGATTQQLATGQASLARLALYEGDVFWTAGGASPDEGTVMVAPKNGALPARMIAGKLSQPFGIAVDESGVYWTNTGDGTIAKADRLP